MTAVTVSAKYQIVIPREIREKMGIKPGQKLEIMQYGGRIVAVPIRGIEQLRGMLPGIDTSVPRDEDRV